VRGYGQQGMLHHGRYTYAEVGWGGAPSVWVSLGRTCPGPSLEGLERISLFPSRRRTVPVAQGTTWDGANLRMRTGWGCGYRCFGGEEWEPDNVRCCLVRCD
jgi:hypothetical protein